MNIKSVQRCFHNLTYETEKFEDCAEEFAYTAKEFADIAKK